MFLGSFKNLPKRNVLMLEKLTFFHGGLKILPLNLCFGHTLFAEEGPTGGCKDLKNFNSSSCLWTPTKNSRCPLTCLQRNRDPEIPSLRACTASEAARHGLCNPRTRDDQALCILQQATPTAFIVTPIEKQVPWGCQAAGPLAVVTPRKRTSGRTQSRAGKAQHPH